MNFQFIPCNIHPTLITTKKIQYNNTIHSMNLLEPAETNLENLPFCCIETILALCMSDPIWVMKITYISDELMFRKFIDDLIGYCDLDKTYIIYETILKQRESVV